MSALPAPAQHRGDAEPGGQRRAGARASGRRSTRRSPTKCLAAAEKAWAAALAHPAIYADSAGGRRRALRRRQRHRRVLLGGGRALRHHREDVYKDFVTKSPSFKEIAITRRGRGGMPSAMTWGERQALGTISLAVVPNGCRRRTSRRLRKAPSRRGGRVSGLVTESRATGSRSSRGAEGVSRGARTRSCSTT